MYPPRETMQDFNDRTSLAVIYFQALNNFRPAMPHLAVVGLPVATARDDFGTSQVYASEQSRDAGITSVKTNGTTKTIKDNT